MPAMKALKPWVLVLRTILLILRQLLIIVGDNVGQEWVLIYLDLTPEGLLELCERPINRFSKGGVGLPLFLSVSELAFARFFATTLLSSDCDYLPVTIRAGLYTRMAQHH